MKKIPAKKSPTKAKRYRAVITPALRKRAISMLKNRAVAAAVAKALEVSVATVGNIKKAAGLTRPRRAKTPLRAKKK
jgi:DNA invertase Pin-like site-specific DNA recombinase